MIKQEILDYISTSPQNTNPAVLSTMLDSFAETVGGNSGGIPVITLPDPIIVLAEGGSEWRVPLSEQNQEILEASVKPEVAFFLNAPAAELWYEDGKEIQETAGTVFVLMNYAQPTNTMQGMWGGSLVIESPRSQINILTAKLAPGYWAMVCGTGILASP